VARSRGYPYWSRRCSADRDGSAFHAGGFWIALVSLSRLLIGMVELTANTKPLGPNDSVRPPRSAWWPGRKVGQYAVSVSASLSPSHLVRRNRPDLLLVDYAELILAGQRRLLQPRDGVGSSISMTAAWGRSDARRTESSLPSSIRERKRSRRITRPVC